MTLLSRRVPTLGVAAQTRNVAGLVTTRRTNTTGAMTFVESNWTYDKLGRVTSQLSRRAPARSRSLVNSSATSATTIRTADPQSRNEREAVPVWLRPATPARQRERDLDDWLLLLDLRLRDGRPVHDRGSSRRPRRPQAASSSRATSRISYAGVDPEQVTALINATARIRACRSPATSLRHAGNQTARCLGTVTTPTCTGESTDYVYDGKDQLRRATKKLNGAVQGSEEYWYDVDGNRLAVVKRDGAGTKTELVSFIRDVEAHYDGAGAVAHVYSHLSLGTPVARVDRTSNTTAAVEFQFHGLASSTLAAVSDDRHDQRELQLCAVRRAPRSHRTVAAQARGPRRTSEGLNDKYEDDVSGLAYYGARYYDKTLIGWTQGDPLYRFAPDAAWKTPTRSNLYRFSGNNPLRYVDPDGLDLNQALAEVNKKCQCSDTDFNKSSTFDDILDVVTQFIVPGYAELRFATEIIGGILNNDKAPGFDITSSTTVPTLDLNGPKLDPVHAGPAGPPVGEKPSAEKPAQYNEVLDSAPKQLGAPKQRGSETRQSSPEHGTFHVDAAGNALPGPPGSFLAGPEGHLQVKDAKGKPTGVRRDSAGHPKQQDPKAQRPHGHQPGFLDEQGNPHLPIKP